jgi:hypothetical protein
VKVPKLRTGSGSRSGPTGNDDLSRRKRLVRRTKHVQGMSEQGTLLEHTVAPCSVG